MLNTYNEGWNGYINGIKWHYDASISWRDGWKDAKEYHRINKILPNTL